MNVIELRELTTATVRELEVRVGAGEVVALVGANGSGTSAAIRSVCGLERVISGAVVLFGRDMTGSPPRERARLGLGTVLDDRGVFRQLTVAENLAIAGGRERAATELAVDCWFPVLRPLMTRRAGLLSGGEQTMVALARAMLLRPRALVVDDLSTGLAPATAEGTMHWMRGLAAEWGTGVLVADQAPDVALASADRAYVLRHGAVAFEGAASALREQPALLASTYLGDVAGLDG